MDPSIPVGPVQQSVGPEIHLEQVAEARVLDDADDGPGTVELGDPRLRRLVLGPARDEHVVAHDRRAAREVELGEGRPGYPVEAEEAPIRGEELQVVPAAVLDEDPAI